jgi:cardiolipin synthase
MTDESPDTLLTEAHFPHVEAQGPALIRLVNSGPTSEMESIADAFFLAVTAAQRQVILVTPYFVPPRDIVQALRTAAMRGLDVRVVVPKRTNHICAGLAGQGLYQGLLDSGVRIFERRPPFMHAKACMVDDAFAIVGTANLDVRSLRLNYETNLAVHEEGFINELKRIVLNDIAASDEIDPAGWRARPVRQRALENLASLLMPML